jgi:hypothetical protein
MNYKRIFLILIAFYTTQVYAQFTVEKFINSTYDIDIVAIKETIKDKKIEEKENKGMKSITYYEWLNPFSIKVGYIFDKEGKQRGRMLLNGKENETESKKVFELFKKELVKIYGNDFSEMSMFGAILLQWKNVKDFKVMLSRKDDKAALFIMKDSGGEKK